MINITHFKAWSTPIKQNAASHGSQNISAEHAMHSEDSFKMWSIISHLLGPNQFDFTV